jgi:acylphosphatase
VIFSGHVQGVGFRMTALHCARDLPLSGTVRNLDDGAVELIAEGSPADIDTLIARLREHFHSYIRTISQSTTAPTGHPGRGLRVTY